MSIFAKYKDIKGEVSDEGYKNWIDIDSYSLDARRPRVPVSGSETPELARHAILEDVRITRRVDKATPGLARAALDGSAADLELHLTQTGDGSGARKYLELTFENAIITSYSQNGMSQAGARPAEHLIIAYTALKARYIPYDNDGIVSQADTFWYDSRTAKIS